MKRSHRSHLPWLLLAAVSLAVASGPGCTASEDNSSACNVLMTPASVSVEVGQTIRFEVRGLGVSGVWSTTGGGTLGTPVASGSSTTAETDDTYLAKGPPGSYSVLVKSGSCVVQSFVTVVAGDAGMDAGSSDAAPSPEDASPVSDASGDAADSSSEGPPVITSITCGLGAPTTCAPGTATPQTGMILDGVNLRNPALGDGPVTVTWGTTAGGSVGLPDDSTTDLSTAVPTAAAPGSIGVTVTNVHGTSAPFTFVVQ